MNNIKVHSPIGQSVIGNPGHGYAHLTHLHELQLVVAFDAIFNAPLTFTIPRFEMMSKRASKEPDSASMSWFTGTS